jgi:predicted alpha/beta-hydrolase family hydrolase
MALKHTMLVVIGALTLSAVGAQTHPDLARESRMAEQLVDAILDGEPLDLLAADGKPFLGIYTEHVGEGPARGTLLILHGRGFHPDWPTMIHPLRVAMTTHGWNTLAIQLPVLDKEARYYDYVPVFPAAIPRIEAAIAEARARSPGPLVVVAHSCGYHMAQHWIAERGRAATDQIDAFVGIGMGATDTGQRMVRPFVLDQLTLPTLDLLGSRDYPAVRRLAPMRWAAMRRGGHPHNAQIIVPGADHYFVDRNEALVDVLATWLEGL